MSGSSCPAVATGEKIGLAAGAAALSVGSSVGASVETSVGAGVTKGFGATVATGETVGLRVGGGVLKKHRAPSVQHSVQQSHENKPPQSAISSSTKHKEFGIDPTKSLPFMSRTSNEDNEPIDSGIVPVIEFPAK
mmetsp:Transcript_12081/g.29136  ORF Transcript_12081/g.29136 Transcript_12081/m.29136 type:complete len:135 (+) Transcript_12081:495-899(+)